MPAERDATGRLSVSLFEAPPGAKSVSETLAKSEVMRRLQKQCRRNPRLAAYFAKMLKSPARSDVALCESLGLASLDLSAGRPRVMKMSTSQIFDSLQTGKLLSPTPKAALAETAPAPRKVGGRGFLEMTTDEICNAMLL